METQKIYTQELTREEIKSRLILSNRVEFSVWCDRYIISVTAVFGELRATWQQDQEHAPNKILEYVF